MHPVRSHLRDVRMTHVRLPTQNFNSGRVIMDTTLLVRFTSMRTAVNGTSQVVMTK